MFRACTFSRIPNLSGINSRCFLLLCDDTSLTKSRQTFLAAMTSPITSFGYIISQCFSRVGGLPPAVFVWDRYAIVLSQVVLTTIFECNGNMLLRNLIRKYDLSHVFLKAASKLKTFLFIATYLGKSFCFNKMSKRYFKSFLRMVTANIALLRKHIARDNNNRKIIDLGTNANCTNINRLKRNQIIQSWNCLQINIHLWNILSYVESVRINLNFMTIELFSVSRRSLGNRHS